MQTPEQDNRMTDRHIKSHESGLGMPPSEEAVEQRAQELAYIQGRTPEAVTREDRQQAWQELQGYSSAHSTEEDHSDIVASSNPADIAVDTGHENKPVRPSDEQQLMEKEINEGMEEAEHERMLQGNIQSEES